MYGECINTKISLSLAKVCNFFLCQASWLVNNKTGYQASQDVVFNKYPFFTQLFTISTQIYFLPSLLSTLPISLVSALMPMYLLGMVRVVELPLTPVCYPVPLVAFVLSYLPAAMASSLVNLAAAVIVDTSIKAYLSMNSASNLMAVLPGISQVIIPTSTTASLPLLCVNPRLISHPEVPNKSDLICPNLSYQGGLRYGIVLFSLSFGVVPDTNIPPARVHGS